MNNRQSPFFSSYQDAKKHKMQTNSLEKLAECVAKHTPPSKRDEHVFQPATPLQDATNQKKVTPEGGIFEFEL